MASSIGIGNINIEPVELKFSEFNLHNLIQLDPSLITGNDVYVSPTGGLTEDGPYEFTLAGDSSFHKILNLSRLFGEFHLIDPTTNDLIKDAVDVSFVNNIGHSWISSIELFFNDKMSSISRLRVMHINLLLKTAYHIQNTNRNQIFQEVIV